MLHTPSSVVGSRFVRRAKKTIQANRAKSGFIKVKLLEDIDLALLELALLDGERADCYDRSEGSKADRTVSFLAMLCRVDWFRARS